MRSVSSKEVALVSGGEQEISYVGMLDEGGYFDYYDSGAYMNETSFPAYTGDIPVASPSFTDQVIGTAAAVYELGTWMGTNCVNGAVAQYQGSDSAIPDPDAMAQACYNSVLNGGVRQNQR